MLKNNNIFYSRLGERQAMLRAAGAIVGMGGKRINDSANSGKYNIVLETKGYSHYCIIIQYKQYIKRFASVNCFSGDFDDDALFDDLRIGDDKDDDKDVFA